MREGEKKRDGRDARPTFDEVLYIRLRALCCSEWGVAPPVFDGMAEREEIALEDAIEAVMIKGASGLGFDVMKYLFRERAIAAKGRFENLKALVAEYQVCQDEERKRWLEGEMTRLNKVK